VALGTADLLPGEAVILTKNANAVIDVGAAGLSRFAYDDLMWAVGMAGREAIGGRLHLTNYRLVFKAHALNRMRGRFSVFLPTVRRVGDASAGIVRRIEVLTGTQRFTFVVWGVPRTIAAIDQARAALGTDAAGDLARIALADIGKIGELRVNHGLERVNTYYAARRRRSSAALGKTVGPAETPVQQASTLNLIELTGLEP
jgi:hypothetical protein